MGKYNELGDKDINSTWGKGYFLPGHQSLAFKVIKDQKHHVTTSKDANTDNSYKIGLSATLIAWFGDVIPESPQGPWTPMDPWSRKYYCCTSGFRVKSSE